MSTSNWCYVKTINLYIYVVSLLQEICLLLFAP